MAEEDLIFGKNRHMFGGIEPNNMTRFDIISKIGTIKIVAVLPKDTIVEGQTLCTVAGAVIVRRTDRSPVDEFDGDIIANIKTSATITDSTAILSNKYYYSAFPYTTQGVYNRNPENRVKYSPTGAHYIYGYDLDTANADPDSRVTYPSDVDNEMFEPAKMNFTGTTAEGTFSYGDWPSTPGEGFMPRPCMFNWVNKNKTYYLDPNDYTKKLKDGTPSDYDKILESHDAMMEWPKIYTKRELVNGIYKFRCSPVKIDETWECWSNYDANNEEIDHFYTAIYKRGCVMHSDSSSSSYKTLRSIAGYTATTDIQLDDLLNNNVLDKTTHQLEDYGRYIETLSDHLLIQDLLIMMAKTTDLKTAYGDGWSETPSNASGGLEKKGLFYGAPKYSNSSTKTGRVKIFGMEDYWDNHVSRRLAGWINNKGVQKVKLTFGTKDGSTATNYNLTGDGYLTIPDAYSGSGGYISECRVEPYGRIPVKYNGSKTTYECDYCSSNNIEKYYAIISGLVNSNENRGPLSVALDTVPVYSTASQKPPIGAAVSYKPLKGWSS